MIHVAVAMSSGRQPGINVLERRDVERPPAPQRTKTAPGPRPTAPAHTHTLMLGLSWTATKASCVLALLLSSWCPLTPRRGLGGGGDTLMLNTNTRSDVRSTFTKVF